MSRFFIGIAFLLASIGLRAQTPVKFHDETSDTVRLNAILQQVASLDDPNSRVEAIARQFISTPYVASTLESADGGEILTVNLDEMDCTTFVETVIALAISAGEQRLSWRDFLYNLQRVRYRSGTVDGYVSRLHYVSDWIVDNVHRGNFAEVTNLSDLSTYEVKTIDFMTQNRDLYPALADSLSYARMRDVETGYRSHRFPIIKSSRVAKAAKTFLKPGDIVALTTSKRGLDVSHLGIVVFVDQQPHLLHASSSKKQILIDPLPLDRYLQRNRLAGIRVIRLVQ